MSANKEFHLKNNSCNTRNFLHRKIIWLKQPKPDKSGLFIPTLNNTGYMTMHLDSYSQEFVEYAAQVKGPVLEVGAAYGIATLAALARGAQIICNDICAQHLMIVKQQAFLKKLDPANLTILPGDFPQTVEFPANYLQSILMCRVLHLFDGPAIERSLQKAYTFLKPGGKLFIIAETPYLRFLTSFIPEYEKNVKQNVQWPGLVTDIKKYFNDPMFPKMANFMDPDILSRSLKNQGFNIDKMGFIDRSDFPSNRRLDGRECIGLVATKPETLSSSIIQH